MATATPKRVTARPTTTNVLKTFWRATPEEFQAGRDWYANANALAVELARKAFGGDQGRAVPQWGRHWEEELSKAVAVIAVLSPQVHWDRNVEMARNAYAIAREDADGRSRYRASWPGLKANFDKAIRILDGEKPEDVVSGPKVTAFYRAILDPNDPRGIVIDRHAFDVAVGRVMDDKVRGVVLGRVGAYESFVRAYERATKELQHSWPGITPAEVQAVTWCVWRRLKKEGKV